MSKIEQWFLVFFGTFMMLSITLCILGYISALGFAPFGMIFGIFMISDSLGYYKVPIMVGYALACIFLIMGFYFRERFLGKLLISFGLYCWSLSGTITLVYSY